MRHFVFFSLLAAAPLAAQQPFTLDGVRRIVGVGGVELSPDGKTAVVSVSRPNYQTDHNEAELYAVDVVTGASRQLTFERKTVAGARFSPDGKTLAFLSPSDGEMQIWLLPMSGGETRRLTSHVTGVEQFSWRPDGGAIAFAAADEAPKREGEAKFLTTFKVGDQDLFLRQNLQPQHIWLTDTGPDAKEKRLTSGTWSLEFVLPPGSPPSGLAWSPDGKTIAFAAVPAPQSGRLDSVHVQLVDVASGAIRSLTSARRFENNPVFSPDGRSVAYWYPRDGRYDLNYGNEVYLAPAAGGEGKSLTRSLDRNLFG